MIQKRLHPSEFLKDILEENKLSVSQLAKAINVPTGRIYDILHAKRSITVDTAKRFALAFNMSYQFWMNAQNAYDVYILESQNLSTYSAIQPITSRVEKSS